MEPRVIKIMEPLDRGLIVSYEGGNVKVARASLVDMMVEFHRVTGYDSSLVMNVAEIVGERIVLRSPDNIPELEDWLHKFIQTQDRVLLAVVLDLLTRINKMLDYTGLMLLKLFVESSDELGEDDLEVATKSLRNLALSSPQKPPVDIPMYTQSPPKPARESSGKRARQMSPPQDKTYKKPKYNGKASSSWVAKEDRLINTEGEDDIVVAVVEEGNKYEGIKFWEYILHVPVEVGEDTIQLTDTFSRDDFWEWFDKVEDAYQHADTVDFDFDMARRAGNANPSAKNSDLIDVVVRAGYKPT